MSDTFQSAAPVDPVNNTSGVAFEVAAAGGNQAQTIKPKRERKLAVQEPKGSSGTQRFIGRIREEYNAEWSGTLGIQKIDEMRRSDAMVRCLWQSRILPICAGEWVIETHGVDPDKSGSRDKTLAGRIRDFCEEALFARPNRPWSDMLRELLLYRVWGFAPFYRALKFEDEKIWLKDLYLRHPRSILTSSEPFVFYRDDLVGMNQTDIYAYSGGGSVGGTPTLPVYLPIEELVFLVNEREGTNVEGISDLRCLWRPYYAKKNLLQILLMGLERQAVGIPVAHMAEQFSEKREKDLITLVTNLRAGDDAGAVLSAAEKLEMLEGKINADALLNAIHWCNEEMARAWMGSFHLLGSSGGGGGGYAMASSHIDFFMSSLYAIVDYTADQLRRQLLRPLVLTNFGPQGLPFVPDLRATISRENTTQIVDMWAKLAAGDNPLLTITGEDEDWLRRQLRVLARSALRLPFIRPGAMANFNNPDTYPADPGGTRGTKPGGDSNANRPNGTPTGSDLPQKGPKPARQGDRRSKN